MIPQQELDLQELFTPPASFIYVALPKEYPNPGVPPDHYLFSGAEELHIKTAYDRAFSKAVNGITGLSTHDIINTASSFAVQMVCLLQQGGTPPVLIDDEVSKKVMAILEDLVGKLNGGILFLGKSYSRVAHLKFLSFGQVQTHHKVFWQDWLALTYQRAVRYLYDTVKVFGGLRELRPIVEEDSELASSFYDSFAVLRQLHTCVVQSRIFDPPPPSGNIPTGNNPLVSQL